VSNLAVTYPLFAYYYGGRSRGWNPVLAWTIMSGYLAFAALSGTSTQHIMNLAPFALIWLSRNVLTLRGAIAVALCGLLIFSSLRFLRQLGQEHQKGGNWGDAFAAYIEGDTGLDNEHSFGELLIFAETVQLLQGGGFEMGTSYKVAVALFIPGVFFPNKEDFLLYGQADHWVPRESGRAPFLYSWPMPFYAEGYLNFGLIGLILASFLYGRIAGWAEDALRSRRSILGVPLWYLACVVTSGLLAGVRMPLHIMLAGGVPMVVVYYFVSRLVLAFSAAPITAPRIGNVPAMARYRG
jgi:hypothetical protein